MCFTTNTEVLYTLSNNQKKIYREIELTQSYLKDLTSALNKINNKIDLIEQKLNKEETKNELK